MHINMSSLCANGITNMQRQQKSGHSIPGWYPFMLMER